MILCIFTAGMAEGARITKNHLRVEAECPDGEVFQKVVDLTTMEIRCRYYQQRQPKRK